MKPRLLLLLPTISCVWISDTEYDARLGGGSDTGDPCDPILWYADADGDGYGDPAATTEACVLPAGYVSNQADCDDTDPDRNPQTTWHLDGDGDGFGDPVTTSASCEQPDGYVTDDTDCDDTAASTSPAAAEDCATSADDDCDGSTDAQDALNCTQHYSDGDRDGYGAGEATCSCDQPPDTATQGGDCDDKVDTTNPGADDVCSDGVDNDCDGAVPSECLLPAVLSVNTDAQGVLLGADTSDFVGLRLAAADGLMGDGQTAVMISASREDTLDGGDVGGLYLHTGVVTGSASLAAAVQLTGTVPAAWFGYTPAAGDLDGDGQSDAVVGAPWAGEGAAYMFFGPITASGTDADADVSLAGAAALDRFGWSISAGDVDDDGQDDLLVGAFLHNDYAGSAYLLRGPVSGADPMAGAEALAGAAGERAGVSVAVVGDVDGDGIGDVLVGAREAASGKDTVGAVYVLRGPVTVSALADAALVLRGGVAGGELGEVVSAAGDLDGDGRDEFLIGAPSAAVAYVARWSSAGDQLAHEAADATLLGPSGSSLGQSLVSVGDMDGDGVQDIAVGAPGAGTGGEAWLLYGPLTGTITSGDVAISTSTAGATLGYGLAAPGDISGDAAPDLFISASNDSTAASRAGAVWLQLGSGL